MDNTWIYWIGDSRIWLISSINLKLGKATTLTSNTFQQAGCSSISLYSREISLVFLVMEPLIHCSQEKDKQIRIPVRNQNYTQHITVNNILALIYPVMDYIKTNLHTCTASLNYQNRKFISVLFGPSLLLWRRKWQPTPVFLLGKSHGQRSLVGYSSWGHRVWYDWATKHPYSWWLILQAILTRRTLQRIIISKDGKNCFLGESAYGQTGMQSPACSSLHEASPRSSENSGSWLGPALKVVRKPSFSHICLKTLSMLLLPILLFLCMYVVCKMYL